MNTIELLGTALGFVGSLSLAAAGVLLAKVRRELRSVRQAKADLLSVDTRAEQLEANGLKTVLQPCGRCEGFGVKGCVRCGDCSGDGYRSRVVAVEDEKASPGCNVIGDLSILQHQYECEREARRAAEKRCEELEAAIGEESSDRFKWVSNVGRDEFHRYLTSNKLMEWAHAVLRAPKATSSHSSSALASQGLFGLYIDREAIGRDRAEWKGLKHHLEEVAKDGEKAETAYGFYRYDPSGRWDWTATNNHFQVFSSPKGNADGAFVFPPQTPPMA